MPDYCMCTGGSCPHKNKCARFRFKPNEYRQSYFAESPWDRRNYCDSFMAMDGFPTSMFAPIEEKSDELREVTSGPDDASAGQPAIDTSFADEFKRKRRKR